MNDEPRYILNRNEGIDTLHRDAREECNLDDAKGRQDVDAETADALLEMGEAERCEHCWSDAADDWVRPRSAREEPQ